jgi:hypothetical protein
LFFAGDGQQLFENCSNGKHKTISGLRYSSCSNVSNCSQWKDEKNQMTAQLSPLVKLRKFLSDYCHFAEQDIIQPLSLWIAGTYIYDMFDSFPYLVINAHVKRAGKTRCSELIGFTCSMPFNVAGATAASLFRIIQDNKPTIMWDEAETLSSEASTITRAFLNVGYRKGQTIPRATGTGVIQWPTYCPKVFVLIGDVYDTLRDRSIIVEMQRGEPRKRFSYETAKAEGEEIAGELKTFIADNIEKIQSAYADVQLSFLTDRDAEIWRPIFALASVLDSTEGTKLSRIAVDMATDKTSDVKRYGYVNQAEQEKIIEREEYSKRLLKDTFFITSGIKSIESKQLVENLRAIDIAPWRKYKGDGLNMNMLADLLGIYELRPKLIHSGEKYFRGYTRKDILSCAKKYKIGVQ